MLLDLAHAIESIDPGSTIGAVAYGQGGTDAFVVSVADGANDPNRLTVAEQLEARSTFRTPSTSSTASDTIAPGVPNA